VAYYGFKPAEQAIQIGDNTIVSADIADGSIVNADLNASAAIAMSKTQFVAGTGLTLSTNTLNVDAAQTQITSVGTIGTGVWNGTPITSAYLNAAQTAITSVGTLTSLTVGSTSINKITHNHGSTALEIENLGSKRGLYVHSDVDSGQDNPLVEIKVDNVAFDQPALKIQQDGVGAGAPCLALYQTGQTTDSQWINFHDIDALAWQFRKASDVDDIDADGNLQICNGSTTQVLLLEQNTNATFAGNIVTKGRLFVGSGGNPLLHFSRTTGNEDGMGINYDITPNQMKVVNNHTGGSGASGSIQLWDGENKTSTFYGNVILSTGGSASNNSIYHNSNNWMYVQGGTAGLALKGENSDDATLYLDNTNQRISLNTNNVARLTIDNSSADFTQNVYTSGNIYVGEHLTIGHTTSVGDAQIQLWDDRNVETTMPMVSELIMMHIDIGTSYVDVLEIEAGYVYTNGYLEIVINGEHGGGTDARYYGTVRFAFNPSGCSFTDVGTLDETPADMCVCYYYSSAKFRVKVKTAQLSTNIGMYFKLYGMGADASGNSYNGAVMTKLV
jgi:hypothetical protein